MYSNTTIFIMLYITSLVLSYVIIRNVPFITFSSVPFPKLFSDNQKSDLVLQEFLYVYFTIYHYMKILYSYELYFSHLPFRSLTHLLGVTGSLCFLISLTFSFPLQPSLSIACLFFVCMIRFLHCCVYSFASICFKIHLLVKLYNILLLSYDLFHQHNNPQAHPCCHVIVIFHFFITE